MTTGSAGSIAGAAVGITLLGVSLGVAGRVIGNTNSQLKNRQRRKRPSKGTGRNARFKRSGIF